MSTPMPNAAMRGPWGIPASLSDLHGPTEGTVSLPLHLCWSGPTRYDVTQFNQRLRLYQIVIAEGEVDDLQAFLDAGHLMTVWPMLRRLLHQRYVRPWEERFPQLAEAAAAGESMVEEKLRQARQATLDGRPV